MQQSFSYHSQTVSPAGGVVQAVHLTAQYWSPKWV
jgi:hypothetical protein